MAKKEKVSFLFYYDYLDQFKELTAEEILDIIQAAIDYDRDSIEPYFDDRTLRSVWNFIKRRIDIDKANYQETCKRNSENIKKRWEKRILENLDTKNTTGKIGTKNNTTYTDIDIDTHIDTDNSECGETKEETFKEENLNFCHFKQTFKNESCKTCRKNVICPLETDPTFFLEKRCTFEEWLSKKRELAKLMLQRQQQLSAEEIELLDNYDYDEADADG